MSNAMIAPAEQRQDVCIGEIDGLPVLATYMESGRVGYVTLNWHGVQLDTDGVSYVNAGSGGGDCMGDVTLDHWQFIKRLAQTDVVERLATLASACPSIDPLPEPEPKPQIKHVPAPELGAHTKRACAVSALLLNQVIDKPASPEITRMLDVVTAALLDMQQAA